MVIDLPNASTCSESQGSRYLSLRYCSVMLIASQEVNLFVRRLAIHERDSAKRRKILDLELSEYEWECVQLLLSLLGVNVSCLSCIVYANFGLQHAEKAQHAFSTDGGPTLHTALPALEALHKAWSTRKKGTKYMDFQEALEAGISKVSDYYERTASSDAHIISMGRFNTSSLYVDYTVMTRNGPVLDPAQKLNHIRSNWGGDLLADVMEHIEKIVSILIIESLFRTNGRPLT